MRGESHHETQSNAVRRVVVALRRLAVLCATQQQKSASKVDSLLRNHEEYDRACHEAIQAAVAKKHKISPFSQHYANDIMQLQPLRHEVEDKCALFEISSRRPCARGETLRRSRK